MIGISHEDDHDSDQYLADTFGEESQGDDPEEDIEFNKVNNNDDEHDDDDDEHDDDDKTLDYEVKEDDDIGGEEDDGCDAKEIVIESDNDNSIGTKSTEGITCSKNNNLTGCNIFFLITVIKWSGQDTCHKIANPALLIISTRMQLKTGLIYLLILILNRFLRQMLTMMKSYLQLLFMIV